MKYYSFFVELKHRTAVLSITWLFMLLISYEYKTILFFILFYTNNITSDINHYIFTTLTEIFYTHTTLSFFLANQMIIAYFVYQGFLFVAPALYWSEYKNIRRNVNLIFLAYLSSIAILNNVAFPLTWKFFTYFSSHLKSFGMPLSFEAKVNQYLNYYIKLYYACFLICFFIICINYIIRYICQKEERIKKFRMVTYLGFLILSTISTPPDILSQIMLTIFLISIYEALIFYRIWINLLIR